MNYSCVCGIGWGKDPTTRLGTRCCQGGQGGILTVRPSFRPSGWESWKRKAGKRSHYKVIFAISVSSVKLTCAEHAEGLSRLSEGLIEAPAFTCLFPRFCLSTASSPKAEESSWNSPKWHFCHLLRMEELGIGGKRRGGKLKVKQDLESSGYVSKMPTSPLSSSCSSLHPHSPKRPRLRWARSLTCEISFFCYRLVVVVKFRSQVDCHS